MMREAKVVCQCPEIRIPDLNLTLYQNQSVWVDADRARLSKDLAHAKSIQAVRIEWRERAQSTKIVTSTKRITVTNPPMPNTTPLQSPMQSSMEDFRAIIAEELQKAITGLEDRLVKSYQQNLESATKKPRKKEGT